METCEMNAMLYSERLKGRDILGDLGVNGK